jgi:hypothetical protein
LKGTIIEKWIWLTAAEISQTILSISSSAADNFKNSGARPDSN